MANLVTAAKFAWVIAVFEKAIPPLILSVPEKSNSFNNVQSIKAHPAISVTPDALNIDKELQPEKALNSIFEIIESH